MPETVVSRSSPVDSNVSAPEISMSGVPSCSPSTSRVGPGLLIAYGTGSTTRTASSSAVSIIPAESVIDAGADAFGPDGVVVDVERGGGLVEHAHIIPRLARCLGTRLGVDSA